MLGVTKAVGNANRTAPEDLVAIQSVVDTFVQLFHLRAAGVIASSHPIQSHTLSQLTRDRVNSLLEELPQSAY